MAGGVQRVLVNASQCSTCATGQTQGRQLFAFAIFCHLYICKGREFGRVSPAGTSELIAAFLSLYSCKLSRNVCKTAS
jgi:hypothetical protein